MTTYKSTKLIRLIVFFFRKLWKNTGFGNGLWAVDWHSSVVPCPCVEPCFQRSVSRKKLQRSDAFCLFLKGGNYKKSIWTVEICRNPRFQAQKLKFLKGSKPFHSFKPVDLCCGGTNGLGTVNIKTIFHMGWVPPLFLNMIDRSRTLKVAAWNQPKQQMTWQISAAPSRLSDSIPLLVVMNAKPTDCEGAFEAANMELFDLNQFQVLLRGSVLAKPKDRDPKIFGLNTLHVACTKNDRTISLGAN